MKKVILCVIAVAACVPCLAQKFSVSANMLDCANFGTLNIDAGYALARHWNLVAGAKYNPFKQTAGESDPRFRQRSLRVGTRYWPWHVYSGSWIGAGARWQEYNMGLPGVSDTSEGDRWGGGMSAGYSKMLTSWLNLDLGLGFWIGYDKYTVYACRNCGRVVGAGNKVFFMPDDFLVSLSFIF